MARKATSSARRIDQWAGWIARQSRGRRMALSLAITVELVILVSVVVDQLLIDRVNAGDLSRAAPAWIATAVGVVVYIFGWSALVGFDWNPAHPWRATRAAVLFTVVGAAGLIVLIVLALYGLVFGYLLT